MKWCYNERSTSNPRKAGGGPKAGHHRRGGGVKGREGALGTLFRDINRKHRRKHSLGKGSMHPSKRERRVNESKVNEVLRRVGKEGGGGRAAGGEWCGGKWGVFGWGGGGEWKRGGGW